VIKKFSALLDLDANNIVYTNLLLDHILS